jgi:type VI secretion system secreted protein VgrG
MTGGRAQPLLLLTSPLGDDTLPIQQGTLHAIALTGREELSRPYTIHVTAVSTQRSIQPTELVYQPVCVTLRKAPHADRFFHGIVRRIEAVGLARRDRWTYRLEVVPRLWFLSQAADCRIFQQKTVVEILQQIFSEHGVAPVEFRIFGSQPTREYTTQYNETDLAFAERLMQEAGYFYFFEHSKSAHTLVVTDRNQAFRPTEHPEHWVIHEGDNIDVFNQWSEALETAYGAIQLQDYDPTKPSTPVKGQQTTTQQTAGASDRDVFVWPAMTMDNPVAADRARFRIEASEARSVLRAGHGYDPEFCPGRRFTLAKDPFTEAEGIDHALHSVEHTASDDTWITGGSEPHYENEFTCLLQTVPWREPLSIGRPAMVGTFSAIVLGNPGEEIHADPIGRIKVRLLFDHRQETVAGMAIWARVMQPWSGNTWGWQHLPRVGTEVAVSFMNGDPDAPVIVGCFYHQEMRPVFPIPAQQTRQGFRSRSTLKGTTQEFSELSFDDKKGDELVFLHAQKNYTTEVEHDQSLSVDHDRTVKIGEDEKVTIGRNNDINVGNEYTLTATTSITLRVGSNSIVINEAGITITSLGEIALTAGAEYNVAVGAAHTVEVGLAMNIAATAFNVEAEEISLDAGDGAVVCTPLPI